MTEWSKWHEHDGKGCPVQVGVYVGAVFEDGEYLEGIVRNEGGTSDDSWDWATCESNGFNRLIRYRIKKPRGLIICEELLANLPEPVGV